MIHSDCRVHVTNSMTSTFYQYSTSRLTGSSMWLEKHGRIVDFLQKLYPAWSGILERLEDETILNDVLLLLAYYFDCKAPSLFVHRSSDIGQVQLDSAKINFGAQAGDIPLVINVYRHFSGTPKRERHHWCAQNCIDYVTIKRLEQAYNDLRISVEGHFGQKIIGNSAKTIREKLQQLGRHILKGNPETLYIHDGRPGLFFLNVKSLESVKIPADSALSVCHSPPRFVLLLPSTSKFDGQCSIICDDIAIEEATSQSKSLMKLLSEARNKVLKCNKICDCGVAFQDFLKSKLEAVQYEVRKQCGCRENEIYVTTDTLTNSLLLYCRENVLEKAREVLKERVEIIKSECEALFFDIDYPSASAAQVAYITTGGLLAQTESQPTSNRTCILWVNSPTSMRKKSDAELTEEYVKNSVLKNVKGIVGVRKFRDFPQSNMWGLVIINNTMTSSYREVESFNRIGAKYKLDWLNPDLGKEVTVNFSIKKELKNKIWVTFSSEQDFQVAKRFPWNEYWVVDTFFFDNREAKFVFKRDRPDLYLVRNDICRMANVGVSEAKYDMISPLNWPEEDLKFVEDELELLFAGIPYFLKFEIEFLSRRKDDCDWKGVARCETFCDQIPDQLHSYVSDLNLRNKMEFVQEGIRQGFKCAIPRKFYKRIEKEIEKNETDFHGTVGVQVDVNGKGLVSVHFIWWSDSKFPDKLIDLHTLMTPTPVYGINASLGELLRNGCKPFQHIENYFGVVIVTNAHSAQTALIYGEPENRIKAEHYMKLMLARKKTSENLMYDVLPLSGPCIPTGLVTALINKNGPMLDRLNVITDCKVVHLNKRQHKLMCAGRPSDIQKLKEELDTCCSELVGNNWNCLFTRVKECVVCFCPIEDTENPAYCLNICGHSYCMDCLKSQVRTHISAKQLPMSCLAENCDTLLSLHDIFTACAQQEIDTDKIVELALQLHLGRNKLISRPCPTPDCPVMYHLPVDKETRFKCLKCKKATCISCHEKWHQGLSCDIKKAIDNLDDEKLKNWIEEEPKTRKMCPSCMSGLEKIGGCDNVHCYNCSTSICWRCLAYFKISGDCYAHIDNHHRNDDEDLVDYEEDA